jgi:oligopeptide transport system substrate-binding protein
MTTHIQRVLVPLTAIAVLFACSGAPEGTRAPKGEGGRRYGGVFNINESAEIPGLFPQTLTKLAAHRVASQIFEGLVRFDGSDLSIRPALATEWEMDATGTVYTFTLRQGVRFHDDPCFPNGEGRAVTADDVVHCFTALCTPGEGSVLSWLFQDLVVGASARINAADAGRELPPVKGIQALEDGRVRITLTAPSSSFLQVLAHQGCWIYPQEMLDHYGPDATWNPVGTGPFRRRSIKPGTSLILERNEHYWDVDEYGNALPFLDAVRYTFEKDKERELEGFENGKLTMISELPLERTDAMSDFEKGGHVIQTAAGMSVQFYGFGRHIPPFGDVRVRRAFAMAIDRKALVDSVLNGLVMVAEHGVVPPGFDDYPYDSVPPIPYDPEQARALLAEAGYPGGEGLPTVFLQVNSDGFGYVRVAGVVQTMLEQALGVRAVITVLPADQHYHRVERAQAQFWREGWVADHPSPENFLALFYGRNAPADTTIPSYLNSTRYRNEAFDGLFAKAQVSADADQRMRLLASAERLLMEDMAVMPLYHERMIRVLQPWVRDLPINGMDFIQLRTAWFDRPSE